MLITYRVASLNPQYAQFMIALSTGLFMLPYFLVSATAGQLADKYDRAKLTRITKIAEIILMLLTAIGFFAGNIPFLLCILFCIGAQSTFFGPIKYALIPQHLNEDELLAGNAYIEAGTFLAILFGAILGGLLVLQPNGNLLMSVLIITCAVIGYISSLYIPAAPPPDPTLRMNWNVMQENLHILRYACEDAEVLLCILGVSWFWMLGAIFLSQFPPYAKHILFADETVVTLFLTVFSIAVGVGSVLCTKLLKGQIRTTYVVAAMVGISLFTTDFYFASLSAVHNADGSVMGVMEFVRYLPNLRILGDLFLISVCGGLYIVPLYTIMQVQSAEEHRARIIAANNIINAMFMVASAILTVVLLKLHFTIPEIFLSVAVLNAAAAVYMYKTLPDKAV